MAVQYESLKAQIYTGDDELSVKDAIELLGMTEVTGKKESHLKLGTGKEAKRYRFANCDRSGGGKHSGNRPFRRGLAVRYRDEILRNKWALNGETIVFDSHGKIITGQHRLAGLVLAEEARKANVDYYKENYGWKGPVSIPAIIVTGIDPEAADTVDLGQKRSAGDVIFRRHEFGGKVSEKDAKQLSRILGEAIRLVWIRTGGKMVSDAPYFLHSVMLDELEKHPNLKAACEFVIGEDKGEESSDKRISRYISLSYAAGLIYLFSSMKTDREEWENSGYENVDYSMDEDACKFFTLLGSVMDGGADKDKDRAIIELAKEISKRNSSDAKLTRDAKVSMFVKAWLAWINQTNDKIRLTRTELDDLGSIRIGGLDVNVDPVEDEDEPEAAAEIEPEPEADEKPVRVRRKKSKKVEEQPVEA